MAEVLPLPDFDALAVGQSLPELALPPLSRVTMALYAGASGDHNPIHIDISAARAAGEQDVFAHGMLVMAWGGRLLSAWVPAERIRSFEVRFTGMTRPGERIICSGEVVEKRTDRSVLVRLRACSDEGDVKVVGSAVLAL
ncbi:MaoC/PaaZ C-terminal domain-containing protein [Noviherbaspirillum pedocola]|uniref:Dehydratase n=1 Tax=Noviherbaspirillum pedocola TaxID=2801341 RepID=A0A934T2X2_9BURK|nr:MaoC/PaaZ C-terminal domain-containing protein [Noviherbaspirillum pedocola]MBK4738707.1 dehydratase [Noviherbaspirillum pedocola]